jgi:hypothetical protein
MTKPAKPDDLTTRQELSGNTLHSNSVITDIAADFSTMPQILNAIRASSKPIAKSDRRYEPPQGAVEELLGKVWCELLGLERISRHDNFFAGGGNSLLAVKVISKIRVLFQAELPLRA